MALDLQYLGSHTEHLDRSFFNNTPTPGAGNVDARRPSQRFRSRRIIQNDLIADYDAVSVILRKRMSRGLQVDAHYTWSKTRDMATHSNGGGQTMDNYDIRCATTARRTGTSRTASWPATSTTCRSSRPRATRSLRNVVGRLADRGRDDGAERHAGERDDQHRSSPTSASAGLQRPDLDRLDPEHELPDGSGDAPADQLLRRDARSRCRRSSRSATRAATSCAGRSSVQTDLSAVKDDRARRHDARCSCARRSSTSSTT